MMQLEGEEYLSLPREGVWNRLSDMNFLARCVPDLERVVRSEPRQLVCRVRPGFAFVRGALEVTFDLTNEQPPMSAQIQVRSKGIGSTVKVMLNLHLDEIVAAGEQGERAPATLLRWKAEIQELGGLLKPVSHDLVQAAAGRVVLQVWSNVRDQLAAA